MCSRQTLAHRKAETTDAPVDLVPATVSTAAVASSLVGRTVSLTCCKTPGGTAPRLRGDESGVKEEEDEGEEGGSEAARGQDGMGSEPAVFTSDASWRA